MEGNGSVSGGGGGGGGMDFQLAEEIMAVIPSDPYEQLDLARKITSMAIAARVSNLEAEVGRLRQKLSEKDRVIFELEEAASRLQRVNHDVDSRLRIALEDNVRFAKERDSVAMTAKKLSRDLAKMIRKTSTFREEYGDELLLETFKRQLMQSLNDDNSSPARTVDIGTCDQAVPRAYPDKDEETNGYSAQYSSTGSTDKGNTTDEALRNAGQKFSLTPYITPRLTPTATPKVFSTTGSPRAYSTIASPQQTSGATSPTKSYDGRNSVSSWYPSSQQSSAANSPPRGRPLSGRTPRIDGKEFFRQARSRLSYEQFSAFLANIKELNAQKQTREETLRKAEEIFGTDNKDLYLSFQGLLSRNVH